jgi:hypothetical protein
MKRVKGVQHGLFVRFAPSWGDRCGMLSHRIHLSIYSSMVISKANNPFIGLRPYQSCIVLGVLRLIARISHTKQESLDWPRPCLFDF